MPNDKPVISSSRSSRPNYDYIEHYVSKLDTLPGVAIKYGVEVADVKRFNGLATDSQMFAHKILRIPLHGKHLRTTALFNPSSSHSSSVQKGIVEKFDSANKWEHKSRDRRSTSAAMELLRGYYGLSLESKQTSNNDDAVLEWKESEDDLPFSPLERPPLTGNSHDPVIPNGLQNNGESNGTESSSTFRQGNGYAVREDVNHERILLTDATPTCIGDSNNERSVRRRFKGEAMNFPLVAEIESKQDFDVPDKTESNIGLLSIVSEVSSIGVPITMLKALDGTSKHKESAMSKVRKSSSTSSLQDQTSLPVNLGIHKLVSKVEEKLASSLILNQAGSRGFSDMPPKPTYRFKTALD